MNVRRIKITIFKNIYKQNDCLLIAQLKNFFYALAHPVRVRAFPVNFVAFRAVMKSFVDFLHACRRVFTDFFRAGVSQKRVADQTAREKFARFFNFEMRDDLAKLFERFIAAQKQNIVGAKFLRKALVERENKAFFLDRPFDQFRVRNRIFPSRVGADRPQPTHEAGDINIGEKFQFFVFGQINFVFEPDVLAARAVDRAPELKKRHVILPPAFFAGNSHFI